MNIEERIQKKIALAPFSTYRIGGSAEYFMEADTEEDLREALIWARAKKLPVTILGGGSNILISDAGVTGLVLKPAHGGIERRATTLIVGAAAAVWDVAEFALTNALSGIEWSIGIPGAMGGAIRGNAGAHGGSFDQVVRRVRFYDESRLVFDDITASACGFAYRHSAFKENTQQIIWEVEMELREGDSTEMKKVMEGYREYRRTSQPKEPSAGCVFKNFLVTDIVRANPQVLEMAESEGKVRGGKIGAGYLIEKVGMMGKKIGGARISDKHANFVVNDGGATASDVASLMNLTREAVRSAYGIEMENEVQYLGF